MMVNPGSNADTIDSLGISRDEWNEAFIGWWHQKLVDFNGNHAAITPFAFGAGFFVGRQFGLMEAKGENDVQEG